MRRHNDAAQVLNWLRKAEALRRARFMIVVAHPDDEVVGIGSRLPCLGSSLFVHVTNGAVGECASGQAMQRSSEIAAAFAEAGLSHDQLCPLGHPDQSASYTLVALVNELTGMLGRHRLDAIFTHPYEGGHPDHDATAFAVHHACRAMDDAPPIIEMASYNQGPDGIRTGEFLPDGSVPSVTLQLSPGERALKRRLLDCFTSQAQTLSYFGLEAERFRIGPEYDFSRPPHAGRLFYENFDWGVRSGAEWRDLARDAIANLRQR